MRDAHAESALFVAARTVARDVGPVPARAFVVVAPHTVAVARGDELTARVGALVAGALGGEARAADVPLPLSLARARASQARAPVLVYVEVRVERGELRLTADVYAVVPNGWDRLRGPPPPPSAHAYVRSPVGAEVRSYLPAIRLEGARLTKVKHDLGTVLALACGDVDGDGLNDLVVVTPNAVVVGTLDAGPFVVVRRAPRSGLGRLAPVPFREPFATAVIAEDAAPPGIYVAWGDQEGSVLDAELRPRGTLRGLPVWAGAGVACVTPDAARGGFPDLLVGCADGAPVHEGGPVREGAWGGSRVNDAWTALDFEGDARLVAAHEPAGTLHLGLGPASIDVQDVGAALALVDLDQDGSPEVVTTRAHGEDALVVASLEGGMLVPRLKWAAPAGVDAVAVCPAQASDAPTLVAAVGTELWRVE